MSQISIGAGRGSIIQLYNTDEKNPIELRSIDQSKVVVSDPQIINMGVPNLSVK